MTLKNIFVMGKKYHKHIATCISLFVCLSIYLCVFLSVCLFKASFSPTHATFFSKKRREDVAVMFVTLCALKSNFTSIMPYQSGCLNNSWSISVCTTVCVAIFRLYMSVCVTVYLCMPAYRFSYLYIPLCLSVCLPVYMPPHMFDVHCPFSLPSFSLIRPSLSLYYLISTHLTPTHTRVLPWR